MADVENKQDKLVRYVAWEEVVSAEEGKIQERTL